MLRDHINNRNYKEKKDEEKNKKDKIKKSLRKSANIREKKKANNSDQDSHSEKKRNSGFLSKEEVIKKIFDRQPKDKKQPKNKNLKSNDVSKYDSNNVLLTLKRKKNLGMSKSFPWDVHILDFDLN